MRPRDWTGLEVQSRLRQGAEGNTDEAVEFLEHMYPGQRRHLVSIPLKGRLEASTFLAHETDEMRAWIEARQGEANLYFHVNDLRPAVANKKASKDDVSTALFVHVDIDDPDAEERVLGFSPPPTVVVFSGGGYHAYPPEPFKRESRSIRLPESMSCIVFSNASSSA
ncbi:MAG: hypothetical protein M9945_17515 [Aquamicrobium sp.]|uniref:hypothetical protein n=1 Tax=Aquamicrobium sp. TaxID=1872579 RepID=UPI00349ED7D8|nr:hypothetical protein [Aquamicrobium sp.]